MAKKPRVTKVTVEYVFEGKTFSVDFPNISEIDAIVFAKRDVDRLKAQQRLDNGEPKQHTLDAGKPFPKTKDGAKVPAKSALLGTTQGPSGTEDRSLWWHTSSCSWFHPEEELQAPA